MIGVRSSYIAGQRKAQPEVKDICRSVKVWERWDRLKVGTQDPLRILEDHSEDRSYYGSATKWKD